MKHMFDRINTASGPYQMVAVLGDAAVFRCSSRNADDDGISGAHGAGGSGRAPVRANYLEEVTSEYINAKYSALPRLFWSFGYEKQRQSLHDSRRFGTLFQVHLWWFPGDCAAEEDQRTVRSDAPIADRLVQKEVLRLSEDLNTNWGAYETRRRVGEWLYTKVSGLDRPVSNAKPTTKTQAAGNAGKGQQAAAAATAGSFGETGGGGSGNGGENRAAEGANAERSTTTIPTTVPEILLQVKETKVLLAELETAKQAACKGDLETWACKAALAEQTAAQTKAAALVRAFRTAHASAMPAKPVVLPDAGGGVGGRDASDAAHEPAPTGADVDAGGANGACASDGGGCDNDGRALAGGINSAPIEDGQGIVAWDEPAAWLLKCLDKKEQRAGGTVPKSHAEKCAKCAIDLGRQWQGGRVEANAVNYGNMTVSLWQGSVLHFAPPMMLARALLQPGESKHFLTHEGEVWQTRDGANNVLKDWVVDVSNGVVQDLVLRPRDVATAYARGFGGNGGNGGNGGSGGNGANGANGGGGRGSGMQQPASVGTVAAKTSLQFFDGVFEGFNNFMQDLSM